MVLSFTISLTDLEFWIAFLALLRGKNKIPFPDFAG
jgi:hypothetical protein